jgi:hypothetical protein
VKLDGRTFYFEIAATVRQIIEIFLGVAQPVLVSDHRLEDWVRSPAETKDFSSSLCVHISTEATQRLTDLTKEAACTSETSVDIQLRTSQYIPEDSELHTRCREKLKSHIGIMNLLIVQLPPFSCYFIHLLSEYSPQNLVLKHPRSMLCPYLFK